MGLPQPISWPIAATGIATKNAPLQLQPGGQLVLDNVRQERKDEWRTRSGFSRDALDDLPGANVPVLCTETPWGGFFGLCRVPAYEPAGRVYSPTILPRWTTPPRIGFTGTTGFQSCSQQSPGLWSRTAISPTQGTPSQMSSAEGGGYRLAAWWTNVANSSIQVSLTATDGTSLAFFGQFNSSPILIRPRCVYSSTANMLVLFYTDAAGGIYAQRWSTTTGAMLAGPTALSGLGRVAADCYLDAIYYGGATITVAFRDNVATGGLRIVEYNPTTDVPTVYTPGANCANTLSLLPDPDASGIRFVAVGTNIPEVRVLRLNSVGVIQTNHLADVVDPYNIAGVAYEAGASWMIVYGSALIAQPLTAVKRRAGVTSGAFAMAATGLSFFNLASGAWREPGTDAMRYLLAIDGPTGDPQPTTIEMALEFENGNAAILNQWAEPQARLLPLNAGAGYYERAAIPQVQRTGTDRFVTTMARITRLESVAGSLSFDFAADAWSVQYLNSTTRTTLNQGQGTKTQQAAYLPAGTLLSTATGQLPCSHGSTALPFKPSLVQSTGAGTLTLLAKYNYVHTVEMPDENGNVWRSPPSVVASFTLTGGNNQITVTYQNTPFENQLRPRISKLWRTDGNGSAYKLVHTVSGGVGSVFTTDSIVFLDQTGDTALDSGEILNAEIQATVTPAFLHVAFWNGRMWGVERDFPTRLWFSKPIADGIQPEFVTEFVVETDDGFGPITDLVSLDDKLVVLKERAIYVVGGDGPDNAGNGAFPSINRISSEFGKLVGAPVASTGREVYLVSLGGVMRLSGSQEIDYVGAPIEKYLSMPLLQSQEKVTGMVTSPGKTEVRIQTTGYRFVHDRTFDYWVRDTGGMVASSGIVMTRMLNGKVQCLFTSSGQMWREAADTVTPADAGITYSGTIRHAWVRPNGIEGWIRLYRGRVLGECTAVGTVAQPTLTVFYDSSDSIFEVFHPIATLTDAIGPIHAEAQVRRQKCASFSMQLDLPAGDASVRLDAWSATVEVIPAAIPLGSSQKWKSSTLPLASNCPPCAARCTPTPSQLPITCTAVTPTIVTGTLHGNLNDNTRDIVWQMKQAMLAKGWTVAVSYAADGVPPVYGAPDTWTSYTKLLGTGGGGTGASYIVFKNPTTTRQILWNINVASNIGVGWFEMGVIVSPSAGFTGGTTLVLPTATDQMIEAILPSSLPFGAGPAGNPQFYGIVWVTPDFSSTRLAWIYGGKLKQFWQYDELYNTPTGWTQSYLMAMHTWGSADYTVTGGRPSTANIQAIWGAGGTWKTVITPGPITMRQANGTLEGLTFGSAIGLAPAANPLSGQSYWCGPVGMLVTTSINGMWGYVRDQWWTLNLYNDCDTFGDNYEFIAFGQMFVPWGLGAVGTQFGLGAPSTNYPTANFFGRSTT